MNNMSLHSDLVLILLKIKFRRVELQNIEKTSNCIFEEQSYYLQSKLFADYITRFYFSFFYVKSFEQQST